MARVVDAPNALRNIERAFAYLEEAAPDAAEAAVDAIRSAVEILEQHPLIGRVVRDEVRELVISFGRTGYIAVYRYVPARNVVRVLALRHQRELDYP